MKIFANALALSILLALLAACGDESSSSVSPEPRQCEEQSDDCDDVSSSSEKISKNSSSSQKSADKGKSSSSEKSTKESSSSAATVKNSSSSAGDNKSSSSIKKEDSSSSAKSSSSVTPKSSSSAKSSSSVPLSSSEYVPFDHTVTLGEMRDEYKKFTDERNGRTYYYLTIRGKNSKGEQDSVTVMAENLNIGKMVGITKDQADDATIERYCYDRDTTNCDRYGGLYQWAEMMQLPSECNTKSCADLIQPNHQGICPDGWRLLTQEDFYIVINADGNTHGIAGVRSSYGFNGFNSTGYSLVGAGVVWDRRCESIQQTTYWYYPEESPTNPDEKVLSAATSYSSTGLNEYKVQKHHGFSVRCTKLEE